MVNKYQTYKAVIVDDNEEFRLALRLIFDLFDEVEVMAEFTDGNSLLSYTQLHKVDMVFIDVDMPGLSGPDTVRALNANSCCRYIVGMVYENLKGQQVEMHKSGSSHLLTKDNLSKKEIQDILNEIKRVLTV